MRKDRIILGLAVVVIAALVLLILSGLRLADTIEPSESRDTLSAGGVSANEAGQVHENAEDAVSSPETAEQDENNSELKTQTDFSPSSADIPSDIPLLTVQGRQISDGVTTGTLERWSVRIAYTNKAVWTGGKREMRLLYNADDNPLSVLDRFGKKRDTQRTVRDFVPAAFFYTLLSQQEDILIAASFAKIFAKHVQRYLPQEIIQEFAVKDSVKLIYELLPADGNQVDFLVGHRDETWTLFSVFLQNKKIIDAEFLLVQISELSDTAPEALIF